MLSFWRKRIKVWAGPVMIQRAVPSWEAPPCLRTSLLRKAGLLPPTCPMGPPTHTPTEPRSAAGLFWSAEACVFAEPFQENRNTHTHTR